MVPPELTYSPVAKIIVMAVADEVGGKAVDEKTDVRSPNVHTAKWKIIPLTHAE
jgi:hypothetical protein